jgi:hypothetical protein
MGSLVTELKIKHTNAVKPNAYTMLLRVVMLATRYIILHDCSPLENITMQENEQNEVILPVFVSLAGHQLR